MAGIAGPEDITVNLDTGIAYISSTDRRAVRAGRETEGAIYALDLESPEPRPVELTGQFEKEKVMPSRFGRVISGMCHCGQVIGLLMRRLIV